MRVPCGTTNEHTTKGRAITQEMAALLRMLSYPGGPLHTARDDDGAGWEQEPKPTRVCVYL